MSRKRSYILLLMLLASSVSSFPFIYAQEEHYWVELELGGVYGLRGETIDITSKTNYTGSNVRIFDPDDILIYDQNWIANDTRQIPISDSATYGTYRIVTRVPEAKTETWFTVLDITGWQTPSFPYNVSHKGLDYQFSSDWVVTAGDMEIDFSTLRKLAKAYNLDISPRYNDMNFRVRFSKGNIKIDLNFAFIHTGAKIIINGTLDHARDISFNLDGVNIRGILNGVRSNGVVFDYSDVLGGEWWAYLPDEKELIVYAPQTFRIDPVIFEDGFENEYNDWTGTTEEGTADIAISTIQVHDGVNSSRVNKTDASQGRAFSNKEFSAQTDTYVRTYIYVDTAANQYGDNAFFIILETPSGNPAALGFKTISDSTITLLSGYFDGDYLTNESATTLSFDTWYCMELQFQTSAGGQSDGELHVWKDGVEVEDLAQTGINNEWQPDEVLTGLSKMGGGQTWIGATIYLDCFVVDDEYIGPEGGGNNAPSTDAASISNMDDTDNLYSQLRNYTLALNVSDADGVAELDTLLYALEIGTGWINGSINAQTNAHTFSAGSTNCTVDAVTNATTATTANYTLPMRFDWDTSSVSNNDIHLWVNDTAGDDSGWSELQTDYFDTVNDLVISGFACDDDRGNLGATLTFSGTVYYENNPGSGTATTFYPPDAEFTSVDFHNSTHNELGSDATVVNGAFSSTVTAENSVGIETYHAYIDMADADYTDADESPTDTYIADRVEVYYLVVSDSRVDINTNTEVRARAVLDYDDHPLGSGDTVNVNSSAMSWDAGNSWFDNLTSINAIVNRTFVIDSVSEATYTVTSLNVNTSNPWCVWDRVNITLLTPDTRIDVSTSAGIHKNGTFEFDGGAWSGTATLNDTETQASVGNYSYSVASITDPTYDLTAFLGVNETWCIFDRQQVQTLGANNTTPDPNENVTVYATVQSEHDGHVLEAGDSLVLKDTDANTYTFTYNGSHWVNVTSWAVNGTYTINTYDSMNEATYGITVLDMDGNSVAITVGTSPAPSGNTFDLRVVNSSGLGIVDCTVTLTNTTDTIFSVDTNSTGHIAQQSVDSGNYTLTITKTGYITYEHDYEINANIYWIIKLFTIEEGVLIQNVFDIPMLVLFGLCVLFSGLWWGTKSDDVSVGLITGIFWVINAFYWLLYSDYLNIATSLAFGFIGIYVFWQVFVESWEVYSL